MMALRKAFLWRALKPRTWRGGGVERGCDLLCPVEKVQLYSSRDAGSVSPRYCRQPAPGAAAEVCPSRSSAADVSVCVHLKCRQKGLLRSRKMFHQNQKRLGQKKQQQRLKVYHQASPRSLRPRPRTPRSTPTDCLKDQPAILSHTSKRNSTLHSLPPAATRGRHGTADYSRALGLAVHILLSDSVRWEVATLPHYQFKLSECSQPRRAAAIFALSSLTTVEL